MNFTLLSPKGTLDHRVGAQLLQDIEDLLEQDVRAIAVDFAEISFLDSRGIGRLLKAQKTVATLGGTLVLRNVSEECRMIFEITQLDQVFKIEGQSQEPALPN